MSTTNRQTARRTSLASAVALALLGIGTVLPPGAMAQARTDTVALTGQAAPGAGGGNFNTVYSPVLNASGQTAFRSTITGGSNSQGIFRSNGGSALTAIARGGQSAPGPGFGTFSSLSNPVLNASGQTAFLASISGGLNTQGVFRSDSGNALTAIARAGQIAPGTGGGTFSVGFSDPLLNASGQTAFVSLIAGGLNDAGIFRSSSGSTLTPIARLGQNAPGAGGGTFSSLGDPVLSASGQMAFSAFVTGGSYSQGIFRSDSGSTLTAIARSGQSEPGAGGGTFSGFSSPVLNASGQAAFTALMNGGTSSQGIFRSDGGSTLTAIARAGQSAPGEGGGTFSTLFGPVLNASGQTAFLATITGGSNTTGIFRSSSGSTLTAIAREGQSAPGAGGGTFGSLFGAVLNDGGQIAFDSAIVGGNSTQGLFLADGRETVAVQLVGASLAGKTVSSFISPSQDSLNNFGQVAYQATFTDGTSGIFRYTPALRWRESFSASWDSASNWTLGIAPGSVHDVSIDPTTSLNVTGPAGAVNLRSLVLGSGTGFATLTLAGGSIGAVTAVQIASRGILAGGGTITAPVVNAGEVRADNLILSGGLINNGTVRGAATGNQRIDTNLSNNAAGLVRVGNGEMLKLVGSAHSNSGSVEVRGGGELQVAGAFTNAAAGRVVLDNGSVRFNDGLTNNGQVQVSFGGATVFGDITNTSGGKIILSGNSNTTFYDAIDVKSGGELRVSTGSTAVFFGLVQQRTGALFTGTGAKFYEGGLAIGGSPGLGIDGGDVNFGAGNVFMVDIGGITPCTAACDTDPALRNSSFDKYIVAGHLGLGGTLKLGSWNGFVAQLGQRFDLLDWGSASGSFDSIDASGLLLPAGAVLDTSSLALDGSFRVVAVPEPQTWALWAAGLLAVGALRARARRGDGHA